MNGNLEKKEACYQVRVMGLGRAVIAKMRVEVLENGIKIASSKYSNMYYPSSDWSEADPLVQKVCQVVFEYAEEESTRFNRGGDVQ